MFPLATAELPTTPAELAAALTEGLRRFVTLPTGSAPTVKVESTGLSPVALLRIDLSEARVRPDATPPGAMVGPVLGTLRVERLVVSAHPLRHGSAGVHLDLEALGVVLEEGRDAQGTALLAVKGMASGQVMVRVSKDDLEALIHEAAAEAAQAQGVRIEETRLQWRALGQRGMTAEVTVRAKKSFLPAATVVITGEAAIDDSMTATLRNLDCRGEGMIGGMASGMIKPKLARYEGRAVPLLAFSLGDARLKDVRLTLNGELRLEGTAGQA